MPNRRSYAMRRFARSTCWLFHWHLWPAACFGLGTFSCPESRSGPRETPSPRSISRSFLPNSRPDRSLRLSKDEVGLREGYITDVLPQKVQFSVIDTLERYPI